MDNIKAAETQASAAAHEAMSRINVAAITAQAMAQARMELARVCRHARPGPAKESDSDAISRLAAGCVDTAAINREVQQALREAQDEIRNAVDLSTDERAMALAAVDGARAEMARNTHR